MTIEQLFSRDFRREDMFNWKADERMTAFFIRRIYEDYLAIQEGRISLDVHGLTEGNLTHAIVTLNRDTKEEDISLSDGEYREFFKAVKPLFDLIYSVPSNLNFREQSKYAERLPFGLMSEPEFLPEIEEAVKRDLSTDLFHDKIACGGLKLNAESKALDTFQRRGLKTQDKNVDYFWLGAPCKDYTYGQSGNITTGDLNKFILPFLNGGGSARTTGAVIAAINAPDTGRETTGVYCAKATVHHPMNYDEANPYMTCAGTGQFIFMKSGVGIKDCTIFGFKRNGSVIMDTDSPSITTFHLEYDSARINPSFTDEDFRADPKRVLEARSQLPVYGVVTEYTWKFIDRRESGSFVRKIWNKITEISARHDINNYEQVSVRKIVPFENLEQLKYVNPFAGYKSPYANHFKQDNMFSVHDEDCQRTIDQHRKKILTEEGPLCANDCDDINSMVDKRMFRALDALLHYVDFDSGNCPFPDTGLYMQKLPGVEEYIVVPSNPQIQLDVAPTSYSRMSFVPRGEYTDVSIGASTGRKPIQFKIYHNIEDMPMGKDYTLISGQACMNIYNN